MSRSARTLVVAEHCPAELRPRPPPPAAASSDPAAPPPPPPRNGGWCLHDFALHKQLGVGATSVVFQGAHSRTGLCVALKVYFKAQMSALNRHQVQRETEIHCRLDHVNIIAMVRPSSASVRRSCSTLPISGSVYVLRRMSGHTEPGGSHIDHRQHTRVGRRACVHVAMVQAATNAALLELQLGLKLVAVSPGTRGGV